MNLQSSTYKKVASHEAENGSFDTCILLFSGGLDSSVNLKWIQENYHADVITLTVNNGVPDDPEAIKKKALSLGAKEAYVIDTIQEFAESILTQAIKANADYQGGYHLFCPLGRVMIAQTAVALAHKLNVHVIAHGCTGKGNDQIRFEHYITTLDPTLKIIAPVRECSMGRDEELEYAKEKGIPVVQSADDIYSHDENIWGVSDEGGEIEDIGIVPDLNKVLVNLKSPEKANDKAKIVKIEFKEGVPIALNGNKQSMLNIISKLTVLGTDHAIGITHLIEDRTIGLKVRGIYEEPAAEILIKAHKALEKLVSTTLENEMKPLIDQKWSYMCYHSQWFNPLMHHLNAFIDSVNKKVTGTVKMHLYKGQAIAVAATSPYSLFDENLATFMNNSSFNQNAAAGFIELYGLANQTAYHLTNKCYE